MKENPVIAYKNYEVNDFYDWLNCFAEIILKWCNKITAHGLLSVFEYESVDYWII